MMATAEGAFAMVNDYAGRGLDILACTWEVVNMRFY